MNKQFKLALLGTMLFTGAVSFCGNETDVVVVEKVPLTTQIRKVVKSMNNKYVIGSAAVAVATVAVCLVAYKAYQDSKAEKTIEPLV